SLDSAQPLSQFIIETLPQMPPSARTRYRMELAHQLGRFMARVHRAGIWHRDLHAGNILVQLSDDEMRLFLIDLHAVTCRSHLAWPTRRDNLVIFNRWFSLFAERTDRRRFWEAYSSAERAEGCDVKSNIFDIEVRTCSSNLLFWRHRDRRCLANNRY